MPAKAALEKLHRKMLGIPFYATQKCVSSFAHQTDVLVLYSESGARIDLASSKKIIKLVGQCQVQLIPKP
jgi:hypothetical protein